MEKGVKGVRSRREEGGANGGNNQDGGVQRVCCFNSSL